MSKLWYKDKIVIITGGSSGIGFAIAREFIREQAGVVIIARNSERLAKAKHLLETDPFHSPVLAIAADVSDRVKMKEVMDNVSGHYGRIDVLVNCAGYINCGRFTDQATEDIEQCLLVNYMGAVNASKAAWEWLRQSKGQLAFISSVAGYMGLIGYSSYAPPKFALTGLAECLRMEAVRDGMSVSVMYPPDTDTPLLEYERKYSLPESRALSENIKVISAERVAAKFIRGLREKKFEIYCDFNSRFLRTVKNNFPSLFYFLTLQVVKKAVRKS